MQEQVEAHFGRHPDAEIYCSQPGLGQILAARVLAEFGDDPSRYADARSRKNDAATSPITRQSGRKKLLLARCVHNDRLVDDLGVARVAIPQSPNASGGRPAMGEDVSLAGENHGMHASPFAWRDTVEQRSAMAGQAQVDSGRELHGGEVERALGALGEDLGEAPA